MYSTRLPSELFDSLDYLVPPVKKYHRAVRKDSAFDDFKPNDQLMRDFRRNIFTEPTTESDVQNCSSLLLKKTTKRLIQEQYSILNLNSNRVSNLCSQNTTKRKKSFLKEERPLVRVTVIPTAIETQTSKVFKKRCRHSKRIETTVSNRENSVKSQNVYLSIKGGKRGKVHDIKTSGSVDLSNRDVNEKYDDLFFRRISESKQFLDSLNMDKRKRKERKEVKNKKPIKTITSDNCNCPKVAYGDRFSNVDDLQSRVTVVGQLGLNQDERYVLKYAATVNDKPIKTNFVGEDRENSRFNKIYHFNRNQSRSSMTGCNEDNCESFRTFRRQDSNVQTDFENSHFITATTRKPNRLASQSTQVDFNFTDQAPKKRFKNQIIQCNSKGSTTFALDTEAGDNALKECQSPLVVISVYPRQDNANENDTVKIVQRQASPGRKVTRSNITREKPKGSSPDNLHNAKKMETKLPRSRSPSPKAKIETKFENKSDARGRKYNSYKRGVASNVRSPKSYIVNNLREHPSCHCNTITTTPLVSGTENLDKQQVKSKTGNPRDTERVKKALVNSFMKNINVIDRNNKKSKSFQPKDDASKVTINIDGENEQYDVLLERSTYDTGVSVRKTVKVQAHQNHSSDEEVNAKSLENILMLSNRPMGKNIFSRDTACTRPPHDVRIKPRGSRLNIRDSIEICRRQGRYSNNHFQSDLKSDKNDSAETFADNGLFAPVKHYNGDDCSISDPNERDREIRELLGVGKSQRRQDKVHTDSPHRNEGCCCLRKCSTGSMTPNSFSKYLSNECLVRNNKNEMQNKIVQVGSSHLAEKTLENANFTLKHQFDSNVSKKSRFIDKLDYNHLPKIHDLVKTEDITMTQKVTEDSSKKDFTVKNDVDDTDTRQNEPSILTATFKREKSKREFPDNTNIKNRNENVLSQNLILNRNIQIFLQLEQFNRKRPVVLNQKQYDKVKKIVECTVSKKLSIEKRKRKNYNVVSVGEIKVKQKVKLPLNIDREVQTDRLESTKRADSKYHKHKYKKTLRTNREITADLIVKDEHNAEQKDPRQTVSSMEIRFARVEYKKCVAISSSSTRFTKNDIQSLHTSKAEKHSKSILTLFKGHKKSPTPNLGTSAFSLYSDVTNYSNKSYKRQRCAGDFKPKKPFLQRLVSCLMMRSTQSSKLRDGNQILNIPSVNSSVDSYHLSTSLLALEMSSSLYDTSASFYSNHTILPVNKTRRGFFSSVRGFLRLS